MLWQNGKWCKFSILEKHGRRLGLRDSGCEQRKTMKTSCGNRKTRACWGSKFVLNSDSLQSIHVNDKVRNYFFLLTASRK